MPKRKKSRKQANPEKERQARKEAMPMISAHDVAIAIIGFEHPGARVIVAWPPEDKVSLEKNMVATSFKKACEKIIEILSLYHQEVDYLRESSEFTLNNGKVFKPGHDVFRGGRAVRIICRRCQRFGRFSLIAVGFCFEQPGGLNGIEVQKVFFHNRNCCTMKKKITGDNLEVTKSVNRVVDFDFERIFGSTYKTCVEICDGKDATKGECPPGKHINFGIESIKYCDRCYQILPDPVGYGDVSPDMHRNCMIRLLYHISASQNISEETAPRVFDLNGSLNKMGQFCSKRGYVDMPNDKWHLYFSETSLLFGGHHMHDPKRDNPHTPIHQVCHRDGETGGQKISNNDAFFSRFLPASFVVPIKNSRTIYFGTSNNTTEVELGEYLIFSGNIAHGGVTWVMRPDSGDGKEWHPAIHGHLDSYFHERMKGHLDMEEMGLLYFPPEHWPLVSDGALLSYFGERAEEISRLVADYGRGNNNRAQKLINIFNRQLEKRGLLLTRNNAEEVAAFHQPLLAPPPPADQTTAAVLLDEPTPPTDQTTAAVFYEPPTPADQITPIGESGRRTRRQTNRYEPPRPNAW